MALFGDALVQEITALVYQRYQELGLALGERSATQNQGPAEGQTSLQGDLRLLIRVANGECPRGRATADTIRQLEEALARVLGVLLGNALQIRMPLTEEFWQTDISIVISRVRWWLSVDDLITISNAAALAFGENTQANRMRIVRAIDKGLLEWVPDPSVANPQQNRRVLRPQVERLRDQRRLPE